MPTNFTIMNEAHPGFRFNFITYNVGHNKGIY